MEIESRKVSDSIVETVHMVRPQHLNASDRLFGGALMQWIDEVAGMVAKTSHKKKCNYGICRQLKFPARCICQRYSCDHRKGNLCR